MYLRKKALMGGSMAALALSASLSALADDNLRINGFLTAGVTGSNLKSLPACPATGFDGAMVPSAGCTVVTTATKPLQYGPYYDHISNVPSWSNDTILGLQTDYKIDDKSSMTAQLVSYGQQNFQVMNTWAYATFKPTNSWQFRIGRQRVPFYMLSEQLDVGMSYPWVRPPVEMYTNPVNSYDGLSGKYQWMLGDVSGDIGALVGDAPSSSNSPYIPLGFIIKNIRGVTFNIYDGNFTFHGGVNAGNVNLNLQDDKTPGAMFQNLNSLLTAVGSPGVTDQLATYYNLGMIYDDGSWLLMSEVSDLRYGSGTVVQDRFDGYVTLGYHMGSFMPNFTYSMTRTNSQGNSNRQSALQNINNNLYSPGMMALKSEQLAACQSGGSSPTQCIAQGINSLTGAEQSIGNQGMQERMYTLGVRWDMTPKMSAKLEWSYVTGLGTNYAGTGGGGWGQFSDAPLGGHASIYSFVVNAMF